ncbi:AI-2E family transporter [Vitiosangium sp. GDMCC 1.1324]|uniref:AI-2E family transporter n=1 Tax=Vitiosangium sp. (strain GDMCC 1.1324) TaxID=2138576 RepID=UPI000D398E8B|nr:AI-2E family transporter [Vitiosangium sp. GDMCC 1.1324]PTL79294.1 AI-2E family transporter [Vitiosangium sp. GDMCC 1.1324]
MASEQAARRVFIGLILLSIALVLVVASPFFEAFFLAAVLAGAFQGLQTGLTRHLHGRRGLAAGLICVGIILALLVPIAALTAFIISEVAKGVEFISTTVQQRGLEGLLAYVPGPMQGLVGRWLDRFQTESVGLWQFLQQHLSTQGAAAAQTVTGVVATTGTAVFQVAMMLIALYFLLVDGGQLVMWLESVSPLKRGQTTELLTEFRTVTKSVLVSSIATAGVQALAALVGYLITGVPVPVFFAAVTFFFALIPAVGAAVVCVAAAVLLLATGHPVAALVLALWGIIVVGLSDNVVKPLLARRGMHMHGAIVFFSLLGGLAVFGAIGLLLGPLIVAFFLTVVRIYERDYGRPSPRPGDPGTPPQEKPVLAEPTVAEGEEWEDAGFHTNGGGAEKPRH